MLKMIKFVGPLANLFFGPLGHFSSSKWRTAGSPAGFRSPRWILEMTSCTRRKLMKDQKKAGHGAWRGNHGKHFPDPTKETWDGKTDPSCGSYSELVQLRLALGMFKPCPQLARFPAERLTVDCRRSVDFASDRLARTSVVIHQQAIQWLTKAHVIIFKEWTV